MREKEETVLNVYAICLIFAILVIALGFMGIRLYDTQKRLEALEKGTSESFTAQQEQIDGINTNIVGINENIDGINVNIDSIYQDIEHNKAVQSNTNSALTRLRKQSEQETQELREELKKD